MDTVTETSGSRAYRLYRAVRSMGGRWYRDAQYARLRRHCERAQPTLCEAYLAAHAEPKLHIGCGKHLIRGWLNSDYFPSNPEVVHLDGVKPYPFESNTFELIYSEHMIEHVPLGSGAAMIAECFRVLRPGGRLRLSTPDLQFLLDLMKPDKSDLQRAYIQWANQEFIQADTATDAIVVNNYVRDWGHQFIYDEATLAAMLRHAGFETITRHAVGESAVPALRGLENVGRMPEGFLELESLVLEAEKPRA
jgi:predicted SAM-dependent methyltransferase